MPTGSRDPAKANRSALLAELLAAGPMSRVELSRRTGLSPATTNRLTAALQESGLVQEVGSDLSTGGRPSMLVQFNPDARRILAADITQDVVETAAINLGGKIEERHSRAISGLSPEEKAEALRSSLTEALASWEGLPPVAVGVSVPGPVTDAGVVTLAPAVGWYDFPLGSKLADCCPGPIIVENDVNLIAYGEFFCGAIPEANSLLAIGVFQGVGAGIVEHGRLWRGQGGAAGQFGRMLMDVNGLREDRKGFGQVERRLGETALRDRAVEASVLFSDDASADALFDQVERGEPRAAALFSEAMDEYAFQLVNLCAIVAPEVIVFDGLFGRWSHLVIPALSERLHENVLHEPILSPSGLQGDAKLVGAALYALDAAGGILELA